LMTSSYKLKWYRPNSTNPTHVTENIEISRLLLDDVNSSILKTLKTYQRTQFYTSNILEYLKIFKTI
ncbi:hypothetical protein L9F63_013003, partial [Diploptera punctata]